MTILKVVYMSYLGKKSSSDEDLHHHSDDELDNKQYDGKWTFLSDTAKAIADRSL